MSKRKPVVVTVEQLRDPKFIEKLKKAWLKKMAEKSKREVRSKRRR